MSQNVTTTIDTQNTDGQALAAILENNLDAVVTSHLGAARPSYAKQGTIWVDTSVANTLTVYLYDGTIDRQIATFSI